jgi:hypothetical protein
MNPLKSKADLHIHSRHSTRAADWVLRRLEFPASYSDPLQLYRRLREIGMDFVTITDHNTIAGCLEIAHLPGVIFGEEVTANFPDDECKVHILVWGLTETQHREIQLRGTMFSNLRYLANESLAHALHHSTCPDEADSAPFPETGTDLPSLRGHQWKIPRTFERCRALRSGIADPLKH